MTTQGKQLDNEKYLAWEDPKDPDAVKDYILDLAGNADGGYLQGDVIDTIVSVTVEVLSNIIVGDGSNGAPAPSTDGTRIILWFIAGGVVGNWDVTVRFTTDAGVTEDITRVLQVIET